jgi:hypothetical protein
MNVEVDSAKNMSTRIPGLLKMFGLENKTMSIEENYSIKSFFEIDYRDCDKILSLERNKSFKFLLNAMGGGGNS